MRKKITKAEEQYVQVCANEFAEDAKYHVSLVLRGWKLRYEDTGKIDALTKEMIVHDVIKTVLWNAFEVVNIFVNGFEDVDEEETV